MTNKQVIDKLNRIYKKNLKLIENVLGSGITYGSDLNRIGKALLGSKFKGVYGNFEQKPKIKNGECYIVNRMDNQHWVSVLKLNDHKYTYDSFNRRSYLGGLKNADYDQIPDQSKVQSNCGQRSLSFLVTTLTNPDLFNLIKS